MKISLASRTAEHVRIYFARTQTPEITRMLPQKAKTVEEALQDFEKTQLPDARSYGRTIYADGRYVGDIWCYGIDHSDTPNAMLSYCLFERDVWGCGVASEAVRLFLMEVRERFQLESIGAFTYAANAASMRVLEKNGFALLEQFEEDGVESCYYQLTW